MLKVVVEKIFSERTLQTGRGVFNLALILMGIYYADVPQILKDLGSRVETLSGSVASLVAGQKIQDSRLDSLDAFRTKQESNTAKTAEVLDRLLGKMRDTNGEHK